MARKQNTNTSVTKKKRAKSTSSKTKTTTPKARLTTSEIVTRKENKDGETMVTDSLKEMINMIPQVTPEMMANPTEMIRETAKVWSRTFELANELTGRISHEAWSQGMKSYDESQKMYRTGLETLHTWAHTWQTQTQQNIQRLTELTKTPWK